MASLCGKWTQVEADNYGALLEALGVGAESREVFLSNKAEVEIGCEGDTWSIKSTVMGKTREDKFKLGEERDGVSIVGSPVKFTVTLDGETMVEVGKADKAEVTTRRSVQGGQMLSVYTIGGTTATLKFNKA